MANWLSPAEQRAWLGYRRLRLLLDARVARDLLAESGLSMADYDVLSTLMAAADRSARLTALADRMLWSKSRLSRHIGRMAERGLVSRRDDAADGRGAVVVLTEAGRAAIEAAAPGHVESARAHFIDLLSPAQLAAFAEVADVVLAHLAEPTDG